MDNANKRKENVKASMTRKKRPRQENAFLQYNGGCREYEDIADYWPRLTLKGVVIA